MEFEEIYSNYPNRKSANASAVETARPIGYVGLLVRDSDGDSVCIHFKPKRARKLARQIIKAADAAQADLDAGCTA